MRLSFRHAVCFCYMHFLIMRVSPYYEQYTSRSYGIELLAKYIYLHSYVSHRKLFVRQDIETTYIDKTCLTSVWLPQLSHIYA